MRAQHPRDFTHRRHPVNDVHQAERGQHHVKAADVRGDGLGAPLTPDDLGALARSQPPARDGQHGGANIHPDDTAVGADHLGGAFGHGPRPRAEVKDVFPRHQGGTVYPLFHDRRAPRVSFWGVDLRHPVPDAQLPGEPGAFSVCFHRACSFMLMTIEKVGGILPQRQGCVGARSSA
jgi:hypothetical protein